MTIVSNTSPLCYLALIGHAEVLPKLYGSIHITQKVLEELRHPAAPPLVRNWATTPPGWLKIHSDPEAPDKTLAALDPGERTALLPPHRKATNSRLPAMATLCLGCGTRRVS
jgi:predicted nucleic acid-binding protein